MHLFRILFFLLMGHVSFGQRLMTLEEAIGTALKNNYDIQLVGTQAKAAAIDYRYANAAFLPEVSGIASKVWNDNSQRSDFVDGRKRQGDVISSNLNASVLLDWTLFDGLKMFAVRERVEQLKNLGELNVRNQVVNSIAEVINGYYDIVRQKQQLRAIDTLITIIEERVKLAEKKLSVGLGARPELLQAKVDLNAQKAARMLQETLIDQLREQLNLLTGSSIETKYDVDDSIRINLSLRYDSIATGIERSNPALLATRKTIDIAELTVKERKGDLFPVIQFNSAYNFGRVSNRNVVNPEFQPIFNLNNGFNYGFSATVPIFNRFNARRLITQANVDLEYNKISYDVQSARLRLALNNTFKNYDFQRKVLLLEEDNITLAKENVFIALERFRQGVSTFIELREAQISLEQAYTRLIAARYNTKVAETELLRLKGSL